MAYFLPYFVVKNSWQNRPGVFLCIQIILKTIFVYFLFISQLVFSINLLFLAFRLNFFENMTQMLNNKNESKQNLNLLRCCDDDYIKIKHLNLFFTFLRLKQKIITCGLCQFQNTEHFYIGLNILLFIASVIKGHQLMTSTPQGKRSRIL